MATTIQVDDDIQTLNFASGEAQSTVIPPGKKAECPNGRFLVTRDGLRPPTQPTAPDQQPPPGPVVSRNLETPDGPPIVSVFEPVPNGQYYLFGTNDHDLVSLSNGDVLYITGAFSRMPLTPKPAWFDTAYRGNFGPGARTVVLTWRSTDGGKTFHFVSEIDPARVADGSGALPQFPRLTTPPGSPDKPAFDMGGTDGQLVRVDLATGRLYLTFQCVGFKQDVSQKQHFELSPTRLNKTLVMASLDSGSTWTNLGFLAMMYWRLGVVPGEAGELTFGASTGFVFGRQNNLGGYDFDQTLLPAPNGDWGFDGKTFYNNPKINHNPKLQPFQNKYIYANIWAHTVVARGGSARRLLLTFPATITDKQGRTSHGYRLFFFDRATKQFAEGEPILPQNRTVDNFLIHLVAIDLGTGPVLLYWYDVNADTQRAMIQGRVVYENGTVSDDFAISRAGGEQRTWPLAQGQGPYWYGDYLTAGGFTTRGVMRMSHFYPMWVEPDRTIRYTHVLVRHPLLFVSPQTLGGGTENWQPGRPPVELAQLQPNPREREELQDYGLRKHDESQE